MPGHKNKAISAYGKKLAMKYLELRETDESATGLILKDEFVPAKVFTKTFDNREGKRVTGRDEKAIKKLPKDVYLIFVDASVGGAYGGKLQQLMRNASWLSTHAGKIVYFDIDHMQTLFILAPDEKEILVNLIAENASDKNQIKLF